MSPTLDEQITQLRQTIAEMEAQRAILSDALARRDETGDMDKARETYQQSLDMFTEMGAPGYIKVLEKRLKNF